MPSRHTDEQTSNVVGTTPDVTQATMRALVPVSALALPAIGVAMYLFVFLTAMFNPLLRGIHDYAAGTVVVRTR